MRRVLRGVTATSMLIGFVAPCRRQSQTTAPAFDTAGFNSAMTTETCTPATDWSGRYTNLDHSMAAGSIAAAAPVLTDADISAIVDGLQKRQRRALARAVTLIESTNPSHTTAVARILREITHRRRGEPRKPRQRRIAISGPPGAGKSCFIEALGCHLADQGLTVGVLAVDPSSAVTGGSILGDKTRMEKLGSHPNAFIRPSPSKGHLGGVTAKCWETLEVYEAANFDVTLVETVGVGQSETEASHLTDLFVLLVPPAAGDELQGVKKGIVEMADVVIVTKADGARETLADLAKSFYQRAVMYGTTDRRGDMADCRVQKPVMTVSSESGLRITEAWTTINDLWLRHAASGELTRRREEQRLEHFHAFVESEVVARTWSFLRGCHHHVTHESLLDALRDAVTRGDMTPREAGNAALECVFSRR